MIQNIVLIVIGAALMLGCQYFIKNVLNKEKK